MVTVRKSVKALVTALANIAERKVGGAGSSRRQAAATRAGADAPRDDYGPLTVLMHDLARVPLPAKPLELTPPTKALRRLAQTRARQADPNIDSKNWISLYGGDKTQYAYAKRFWQASLQAADLLNRAQPPKLEPLLRVLGLARQSIAEDLNHSPSWEFGRLRPESTLLQLHSMETPIGPPYTDLPHVRDFLQKLEAKAHDKNHLVPLHHHGFERGDTSSRAYRWQVTAHLPGGEAVGLTSICRESPKSQHWTWIHPRPTEKVLAHMQTLLTDATASPPAHLSFAEKQAHVVSKVATLHWWLAHNPPFYRGSAAVADMLTAAVLHTHGMTFPGWKAGVSADVVALCTPRLDDFVRAYAGLMRDP